MYKPTKLLKISYSTSFIDTYHFFAHIPLHACVCKDVNFINLNKSFGFEMEPQKLKI